MDSGAGEVIKESMFSDGMFLHLKDTQDDNKIRFDKQVQQIIQTQHKLAEIRRDSCGVTCQQDMLKNLRQVDHEKQIDYVQTSN